MWVHAQWCGACGIGKWRTVPYLSKFQVGGNFPVIPEVPGGTLSTRNMVGAVTISINALPPTHTITGGGSYCAGGAGVTIGLNGSETGIQYQLFNGTTP